MFQRRHVAAKPEVSHRAVIVPSGISLPLCHIVQRRARLPVIAVPDIVACRPQMSLLFIARFLALPEAAIAKGPERPIAKAAVAALRTRPAAVALPAVTGSLLLHNLLIGCLNLFKPLLSLIPVGIVDIGVRMIFPAQCFVCFLDFFLGSASRHS